jgi:co-chaperonin GroES (HSP10)
MSLRPRSDALVIELEPPRTTTRGGIIHPDTKQHPIRTGRVVRAGPGRLWKSKATGKLIFWPMDVKVGERICFMAALLQTQQGRQVQSGYALNDNEALIRETDVLFVIEDGDNVEITA